MGTQKNRLNETVLFSTQNICLSLRVRNIYNFTLKNFVYLNLWIQVKINLLGENAANEIHIQQFHLHLMAVEVLGKHILLLH